MRKQLVAAALVVAAGIGYAVPGSADAAREDTLRVIGLSVGEELVDVGPQGMSPGDMLVMNYDFYEPGSEAAGQEVGSAAIVCTFTQRVLHCNASHRIDARGDIEIQSRNEAPDEVVGAIVGGTGEFLGARGDVVVNFPDGVPGNRIDVTHRLQWSKGN